MKEKTSEGGRERSETERENSRKRDCVKETESVEGSKNVHMSECKGMRKCESDVARKGIKVQDRVQGCNKKHGYEKGRPRERV